jgi:hypothetical protein
VQRRKEYFRRQVGHRVWVGHPSCDKACHNVEMPQVKAFERLRPS